MRCSTIKLGMKKIKTFFHVLTNSAIPHREYYKKIQRTPFRFSLTYFFFLVFITQFIVMTIVFTRIWLFEGSFGSFKTNVTQMFDSFPQDLVVTIKNRRLFTNYNYPFIAWFNYHNIPFPIVAVDEYANAGKIQEYDSFVLLHAEGITTQTQKDLNTYPFEKNTTYVINKEKVNTLKNFFLYWFSLVFPLAVLLFFILTISIVPFAYFIGTLIYLVVLALVVSIAAKLSYQHIHYKKVLQISFHAITLPFILNNITFLIMPHRPIFKLWPGTQLAVQLRFSWLFLVIYFLFFVVAVYEVYGTSSSHTKSHHVSHHQ